MTLKVFALLLICTLSGFSQQKRATLYLKDSTELQGYAKINSYDDEIKFRPNKNSKWAVYKADIVEKILIEEKNEDVEYHYRLINEDRSRPYLLVLRIEGELSLYEYYKSLPGIDSKSTHQKTAP